MNGWLAIVVRGVVASLLLASVGVRGDESGLVPPADVAILRSPADGTGTFRWLDAADNEYALDFINAYRYSEASVVVQHWTAEGVLRLRVAGVGLKPNFAYQIKLAAAPERDCAEPLGLTGRWWQRTWTGTEWDAGWNLNNKWDGTSPNPNDTAYFARRDVPDATSPTGRRHRFEPYLVLGYFITDDEGRVDTTVVARNSYHVLWKTSQRARTERDGPPATREIAPTDPHPAYDTTPAPTTVSVFGEWERLPKDAVHLPNGDYAVQCVLTEESFHGSGGELGGFWATALEGDLQFRIGTAPEVVTHPRSAILDAGESAALEVEASGTGPLAYQWRKDGVALDAETSPRLEIVAITPEEAGQYQCRVSNAFGDVESRAATVFLEPGLLTPAQRDAAVDAAEAAKDAVIADRETEIAHLETQIASMVTLTELEEAVAAANPDWDGDGFTDEQEADRNSDPERYVIRLEPGWNLVSIARVPTDNSVDAIFATVRDQIENVCWIWTPDGYALVEDLEPQRGHWVYYNGTEPAEVVVELP